MLWLDEFDTGSKKADVLWKTCGKKRAFFTKKQAKKVAERFGQYVYECPVCCCWHATKQPRK